MIRPPSQTIAARMCRKSSQSASSAITETPSYDPAALRGR
jgi:hypothetical protein